MRGCGLLMSDTVQGIWSWAPIVCVMGRLISLIRFNVVALHFSGPSILLGTQTLGFKYKQKNDLHAFALIEALIDFSCISCPTTTALVRFPCTLRQSHTY